MFPARLRVPPSNSRAEHWPQAGQPAQLRPLRPTHLGRPWLVHANDRHQQPRPRQLGRRHRSHRFRTVLPRRHTRNLLRKRNRRRPRTDGRDLDNQAWARTRLDVIVGPWKSKIALSFCRRGIALSSPDSHPQPTPRRRQRPSFPTILSRELLEVRSSGGAGRATSMT